MYSLLQSTRDVVYNIPLMTVHKHSILSEENALGKLRKILSEAREKFFGKLGLNLFFETRENYFRHPWGNTIENLGYSLDTREILWKPGV